MKTKDIAYIDDLTGISNRRAFTETLAEDLSTSKEQGKDLYLAINKLIAYNAYSKEEPME